ncbi:hypothetical protein BC829DRAFT_450051 [Chytridium lagenaria]|nr:hypothetical protein BC829DRAFT_450051 [Chytridium lagenaria]
MDLMEDKSNDEDVEPWKAGHGKVAAAWEGVADDCNIILRTEGNTATIFTGPSAKCRVDLLLATFKKDELASLQASGTVEEYDKRKGLLRGLEDLHEESKIHKTEKEKKKAKEMESKSLYMRDAAMKNLVRGKKRDSDTSGFGGL